MKSKTFLLSVVLQLFFLASALGQNKVDLYLNPADSLIISRRNTVVISEAVLLTATLVGLNSYWYSDYPKSDFHFINDNAEWLQMDKAGHVFSSYQLGSFGKDALAWSGVSRKNQLLYGATIGFVFLSAVEVLDGYSSNWGASTGDIIANATGTALYVSQELLWKEQRIIPKFSFHSTQYASQRPDVLGSSLNEQILKDYNGQTYWLSTNLHAFFKESKIPKWFNLAIGYGADGMIKGNSDENQAIILPEATTYRQFYFSLDADLTKIKTKSPILKTLFTIFNAIKIPAPTIEINGSGDIVFYAFYF